MLGGQGASDGGWRTLRAHAAWTQDHDSRSAAEQCQSSSSSNWGEGDVESRRLAIAEAGDDAVKGRAVAAAL